MVVKAKNGISIYSTAKGTRYKVRYRKPDRTAGAKGGFTTRAAARAFQLSMEVRRSQGSFVDPSLGRATVAEVAEEWLAARSADIKGTKKSTLSRVRSIVRIRVIPDLGERRIGDLTKGDVGEWVRTLEGEPETIRKTVSVLRGILSYAVDHNRIHANPASKIAQPKLAKKPKRYLDHAQVGDLYEAVNETNSGEEHGYGLVALTLAYTGLRWSELAGLRINDVDLRKRRISVAHTIVQVDGKQIEDVPKSYAARSVPIPSFVADLLSKHIERRRVELDVDAGTLRAQLKLLADKNDELDRVRKREGELTARLVEVRAERAMLDARIQGLQEDRDARSAAGMPTEPVDERLAVAERALNRLPQIAGLELRVAKVPERIARLESQIAKRPRQSELLREHLRVLEQEPLFVGVRTRSWLRNASFRKGWLSPAVKLMDERALQAAYDADLPPAKPLGDIEPHELRHTYASLAVSENANVKALQRALGHEKASVTLDVYADLFEDDLDDVAERLDWKVRSLTTSANFAPANSKVEPIAYDDPMWDDK